MIHKLYFIGLIIITILVIYFYMVNERDHRIEIEKIERMERMQMERDRDLILIRAKTTPCPTVGLDNPRACYVDSGYKCTWNDMAERCDKKD